MQFARDIASFLNGAIATRKVTSLVILAAPAVLGYLRSELSDSALRAVSLSQSINLANLEEAEIREYFE